MQQRPGWRCPHTLPLFPRLPLRLHRLRHQPPGQAEGSRDGSPTGPQPPGHCEQPKGTTEKVPLARGDTTDTTRWPHGAGGDFWRTGTRREKEGPGPLGSPRTGPSGPEARRRRPRFPPPRWSRPALPARPRRPRLAERRPSFPWQRRHLLRPIPTARRPLPRFWLALASRPAAQ